MLRMMVAGLVACTAASVAAETVRTVITATTPGAGGTTSVDVSFLNTGTDVLRFEPPETLTADLVAAAGTHRAVVLKRSGPGGPAPLAAGGFVSRSYNGSFGDGAQLLMLASGSALALAAPPPAGTDSAALPASADPAKPALTAPALAMARPDSGNAFFGNVSAYAPIFAVYGPNTNTDALLQISFKYQLFGTSARRTSWIDGLNFAYTQRLFWDLGSASSPFRNVDYNPELIYLTPSIVTGKGLAFAGQAGIAHMSNGRDGTASRSMNYVYIQPSATLPIGDWQLTLGPRLLAYFGDLSDNPDIARYRGHTGLFAQIGTEQGWRLSTTSRIDFGSGKGAIEAELTYPLNRLVPGLKLYAFGQGFAGYGENLLDYNRRQTRLRIGVGIAR